jgi:hypothetical protein
MNCGGDYRADRNHERYGRLGAGDPLERQRTERLHGDQLEFGPDATTMAERREPAVDRQGDLLNQVVHASFGDCLPA